MDNSQSHIINNYRDNEWYDIQVINDLFVAAIAEGVFGPNATHQNLLRSSEGIMHGFVHLEKKADDAFSAEYKNDLPKGLTIISSALKERENNYTFWYSTVFEFIDLFPDLVFIPINRNDNHYTILILQPEKEKAYYYDSLGGNNRKLEKYCRQELRYDYEYNHIVIQQDGSSCGPAIVDFARRAFTLFSEGKDINIEGLHKFGHGGSERQKDRIKQMRNEQKELLNGYKTGFSIEFAGYKDDNFVHNNNYDLPHNEYLDGMGKKNHLRRGVLANDTNNNSNQHNASNSQNQPALAAWLSAALGVILGVVVTQQSNINDAAVLFLTKVIKANEAAANVIFSLSGIALISVVFGAIGYAVGKEIEKS